MRIAATVSEASRLDAELRDKRPPLASPSPDHSIEDSSDESFAAWLRRRPTA